MIQKLISQQGTSLKFFHEASVLFSEKTLCMFVK